MLHRSFLPTLLGLLLTFIATPALGDESTSAPEEATATKTSPELTPQQITQLFKEVNDGWREASKQAKLVLTMATNTEDTCRGGTTPDNCNKLIADFIDQLLVFFQKENEVHDKYERASRAAERIDRTLILAVDTNAQMTAFQDALAVHNNALVQETLAFANDSAKKSVKKRSLDSR